MNQERFDELAKAVAAPVSRAQMLKMLGGAFLGSALGGWGLLGWSGSAEAKKKHKRCPPGTVPKRKGKKVKCMPLPSGPCTQYTLDANDNPTSSGACQSSLTTTTLLAQASKDVDYSKLADYLTSNSFIAEGGPQSAVFVKDGAVVHSLLVSTYSNSTNTNEVAELYYDVEATGDAAALAAVWDKQQQTLLYVLAVLEDKGPVEKVTPSSPQQTSMQSAVSGTSTAATAKTCDAVQLGKCRDEAANDTTIALTPCAVPCAAGAAANPACQACIGVITARYVNKVGVCSDKYGCGLLTSLFCQNNVCCGITETGCPPNACCPSGQECCNGQCCTPGQQCKNSVCVGGPCAGDICPTDTPVCCKGQCYAECNPSCETWDPSTCSCVLINCSCNPDDTKTCHTADGRFVCCQPEDSWCCPPGTTG